jgi:hypothetical protein
MNEKGKMRFSLFNPHQTIQETIYSRYGMNVRPFKKYGNDHEYDFPEKGMRQTNSVAGYDNRW